MPIEITVIRVVHPSLALRNEKVTWNVCNPNHLPPYRVHAPIQMQHYPYLRLLLLLLLLRRTCHRPLVVWTIKHFIPILPLVKMVNLYPKRMDLFVALLFLDIPTV